MTIERTVLIVGATGRAAAFSAHRAGLCPRVADRFGDVDLLSLCPAEPVTELPAGLEPWLRQAPQTGWMYTGPLENYPDWVDRLARWRPLWGNCGEVLRRVRDPRLLASALAAAGLPTVEVEQDAQRVPRDGSWLCKPLRSAAGGAIEPVGDSYQPAGRPVYYQRRLFGPAVSACYLAAGGEAVLLGITRQWVGSAWAGATGYQYAGSLGPWPQRPQLWVRAARLGSVLAATFGLTGLFGVDAILQDGDLYCVEVNPRYTASVEVLERSRRIPMLQWHLDACCSGSLPQVPAVREGDPVAGKAVVYARRRLRSTPSLLAWAESLAETAGWPAVADLPAAGTQFQPGQPIATVLAAGTDAGQVETELKQRVAALEQTLDDCCR